MGTVNQLGFWDATRAALLADGAQRRDEALRRVEQHANPEWAAIAYHVGVGLARIQATLTSADIDLEMMKMRPDLRTPDKRAMGCVIKRLCANGILRITDTVTTDPRPNCHRQNKRVLRSLIYETHTATTPQTH